MDRNRILRSAARVPLKPDYGLDEAFSILVRASPSQWIIRHCPQYSYVINMARNPDEEDDSIWDLLMFNPLPHQSPFQDALNEFLARLQERNSHLLGWYGPVTHDILLAAAQFQADLVRNSPAVRTATDLSGETTIIALALRCFLDFHILDLIGMDCYGRTVEIAGLPEDGSAVEVLGRDERDPFLTATAYKETHPDRVHIPTTAMKTSTPGCHFSSNLHTMLSTLSQLCFHLLDTRDPRHWPTILYVLLILGLIRHCLRYCLSWMRKLYDAAEVVEDLFQDLARYYYLCTEGGKILTRRWNKEEYAARVGHPPDWRLLVEHACILHKLWFDGEDEGKWDSTSQYKGLGGFPRKVGDFVYGGFRGAS
ncbi:hypothetical protein BJY00DRAFT_319069 [Aspergillus carlsbadensis]|nr:hypothetical protein BJY00DRAFT_319069 [Aspergillus carlsbadensis]